MRNISLIAVISLFVYYGQAQEINAIKLEKGIQRLILTPETMYYSDTAYHTIEEVIRNPNKFVFKKEKKPLAYSFGFVKEYFWFRFRLINNDPDVNSYRLFIGKVSLHHLELFYQRNNELKSLGITGIDYPFNQRPFTSCYFFYPIDINYQDTVTYYIYIDNRKHDLQAGFMLFSAKGYKQFEETVYFGFGIICGIFLLVFAFNFLLYLFTWDPLHVWYGFYIIISVWQILAYEGIDYQYLFPHNIFLMSVSRSLTTQLFLLTILIMMPKYISLKKENSRYYLLISVLKWVMAIFTFSFLVCAAYFNTYSVNRFYGLTVKILYLVGAFSLIITCREQYKKGTKVAGFLLVGLIIYLFGMMDYILFMLKISDNIHKFPSLFQVFSVFEVVIISYGILYRYNNYRKEKNELNRLLIQTKLDISHQLLQTQENERKRIAEDLHDELGSSLAALKLKLQKTILPDKELKDILYTVDKASDDTRNIAHNLMPPEFEKTSLKELLSSYFSKLNTETKVLFTFHSSGSNHHFSKEEELVIYRIIMELTNNILKHSAATDAAIQLIYYEDYLELMAEDNGKGIIQQEGNGIGLKNTRSRVSYLNGTLQIDSDNGTTVIIQIPYKN